MNHWIKYLFKSALFYEGWVFCIQCAARCHPAAGVYVIGLIILLLFLMSENKLADLVIVITISFVGSLTDTIYAMSGILKYNCPFKAFPLIAPYWVISLWALFATLLREGFGWLYGKWGRALLLGAIGGTSSYLASVRLGAAEWGISVHLGMLILAIVWSLLMPFCVWFSQYVGKKI